MIPATPFSWGHLDQWNLAVVPIALLIFAVGQYIAATWRVPKWPAARTLCFVGGALVTFIAVDSVVGVYDMELFSDHMVQHLLLIMVAAPLFAAAAPLDLAHAAYPGRVRRLIDSKPVQLALTPLFGFALYAVFIPATHLTGFFNLMMEHMWVHYAEEIAFLVVGYLFFRHAFGIEKDHQFNPGLRIVYVMAAVPVDTFTGLTLDQSRSNPYPSYDMLGRGTPTEILNNIHLGGAIMWIGGDLLMLLACIPIAVLWVRYETVRTRELDRELDAAGL